MTTNKHFDNRKFINAKFGILIITGLLISLAIGVYEIKLTNEAKIAKIQEFSLSMSGKELKVVSGFTKEFGNYYPVALQLPGTNQRELFLPCTPDQRQLKPGDTVKYEFAPQGDEHRLRSTGWECYLKEVMWAGEPKTEQDWSHDWHRYEY